MAAPEKWRRDVATAPSPSYVVQSRRTGIVIGAGGAADIFAKHSEIAAKMKSAPGLVPTDSHPLILLAFSSLALVRKAWNTHS